jgi:hypothetical protein
MMTGFRIVRGLAIVALAWGCSILSATRASAQLASPSAAALGMADNYTAAARGYNSIYWNPAGLALSGTERLSFAFLPVRANISVLPIRLSEFARMQGRFLDEETKANWLGLVQDADGLSGSVLGTVTYLAGNVGRIGFQLSTTASGDVDLSPAVTEFLLYGNVGRYGAPQAVDLRGSSFGTTATSTAALAFGQPIMIGGNLLAIGATLKYTIGHYLAAGRDEEAYAAADPLRLNLRFPVLQTDAKSRSSSFLHNNGRGLGLDLGAGWENEWLAVGLVARNLLSNFSWDRAALRYRPGVIVLDHDGNEIDTDPRPISEASPEFTSWAVGLGAPRSYALGVAGSPREWLLLTSDLQLETRVVPGAGRIWRQGIGVEARPVDWLPLRTGLAWGTRGAEYAAGIGARYGPVELAVGGKFRGREAAGAIQIAFRP